jgi:hypothetical protein
MVWYDAFGYLGLVIVLYKTVGPLLRWLYGFAAKRVEIFAFRHGNAVITGASDGIGYEYAWTLSSYGFTVVLVARNEHKLEHARDTIIRETGNENVHYVVSDFSQSHLNPIEFYNDLVQRID